VTGVAFLTHQKKFVEEFLAALGFLSGAIAFLSGMVMTMTWLYFSVPLCLNVDVSSFLLILSFMILAATSIMATMVLKNEQYLTTDIHSEYHEVHRHERIPNSHRDIFHDSHRTPDQLIHELQMHGSRDQGIMIHLIID
jgi:hypothetical protein